MDKESFHYLNEQFEKQLAAQRKKIQDEVDASFAAEKRKMDDGHVQARIKASEYPFYGSNEEKAKALQIVNKTIKSKEQGLEKRKQAEFHAKFKPISVQLEKQMFQNFGGSRKEAEGRMKANEEELLKTEDKQQKKTIEKTLKQDENIDSQSKQSSSLEAQRSNLRQKFRNRSQSRNQKID